MQDEIDRKVLERTQELVHENTVLKKEITKHEQIERLLKESQIKYQAVFSQSNDAMMLYNEAGFIDCNEATLNMFGCKKREEFLGHHPAELSPPLQPSGIASEQLAPEKIATAKQTGKNFFEWTHRRLNGEEFPAEVLLTPINLGEQEILQATIRDITERKNSEEELRHQKAFFEAVFLDVPDAMLIANLSREIIKCNPAFTKIYGYSEEEILGKATYFLYESQEEHERQGRERYNLTAEEKLKPYTVNYKRKNGELFPGETIGAVIKDESDTVIAFIGVVRDITERIRSEEKLNRQKADLETSNKELESYSYSIAHDLRSPLRTIISFGQILSKDAMDELNSEEQDCLQRIIAAGTNMANLIDDILELSRITRSKFHYGSVDLSKLGADIMARLKQSNPERKVQWKLRDNMLTKGDTQLLSLALQNLLENAWKFTRNVSLAKIEFASKLDGHNTVYYVKDNGVGFDMKYADNLFKPFHRLHSLQEFEGTGIGLATLHRIIQRHGGHVWVESKENQGSTFCFTLDDRELNGQAHHDLEKQ